MIKLFEKYKDLSEIKSIIFIKAVKTLNIDIINNFLEKGYDMNIDGVLYEACEADDVVEFFIEKGINVEKQIKDDINFKNFIKNNANLQEILIDFGYEQLIYDTVGFHYALKNNSKYSDIVDRYEKAKKYNL